MVDFSDFISRNELFDSPLISGCYTWSNGRACSAMSRLDKFLTSSKWDSIFSNSSQIKLFSPISDHCPVLFDTEEIDWGSKPFRFSNTWLEDPNFTKLVKEWWDSFDTQGWGRYDISKKLILLKSKIKDWVKSVGGHVKERKQTFIKELEGWNRLEERDLEEEELDSKRISKATLWDCLRLEEMEWRLKVP